MIKVPPAPRGAGGEADLLALGAVQRAEQVPQPVDLKAPQQRQLGPLPLLPAVAAQGTGRGADEAPGLAAGKLAARRVQVSHEQLGQLVRPGEVRVHGAVGAQLHVAGFWTIGEWRSCSSNVASAATQTESGRPGQGGWAAAMVSSAARAAVRTLSRRPSGGGSLGIQPSSDERTCARPCASSASRHGPSDPGVTSCGQTTSHVRAARNFACWSRRTRRTATPNA